MGKTRAIAAPASASDSAVRRVASLSGSVRSVREAEGTEFTMAGSIVGTPHYMSPEQARGESETLEEGTDIWALGAILRHILTLEKPVPGETVDSQVLRTVETTAETTVLKIEAIGGLLKLHKRTFSKERIEQFFVCSYCKIRHLEKAGLGNRVSASRYLHDLADAGLVAKVKAGKEILFVNERLVKLLAN